MITHGGAVSRMDLSLVLLQHSIPSNIPLLGGGHGSGVEKVSGVLQGGGKVFGSGAGTD